MSLAVAAAWAGPDGEPSAALGWLESLPAKHPEPNRQACELFTGDRAAFVALGAQDTLSRLRERVEEFYDFQLATYHDKSAAFEGFSRGIGAPWSALAVDVAGRVCTVESRGGVARVSLQGDIWAIGRRCEAAFGALDRSSGACRTTPGSAVAGAIHEAYMDAPRDWGGFQVVLVPQVVPVAAEGR